MSDIEDKMVKRLTNESLQEEVKKLWEVVRQTAERNGNMCVELASMRKARNAADDEATRLSIELAAVTQERDALRREVAALAGIAVFVPCCECNAREFCDNRPSGPPCEETLRAWAKQQAAQAGKGEG